MPPRSRFMSWLWNGSTLMCAAKAAAEWRQRNTRKARTMILDSANSTSTADTRTVLHRASTRPVNLSAGASDVGSTSKVKRVVAREKATKARATNNATTEMAASWSPHGVHGASGSPLNHVLRVSLLTSFPLGHRRGNNIQRRIEMKKVVTIVATSNRKNTTVHNRVARPFWKLRITYAASNRARNTRDTPKTKKRTLGIIGSGIAESTSLMTSNRFK
mmetsp:Transcript_71774/g.191503  ORF Transcript_71774/g.191503 Transcript_71774/m.191503 type:complete len:218 (-) Transcript_71774:248-901(-)